MENLNVELCEMAGGILKLTRVGSKLVKVSYETHALAERKALAAAKGIYHFESCKHCGTWLDQNHRGAWVDINERFLCRYSPTSMHAPVDGE